jgi:hypothetical protein
MTGAERQRRWIARLKAKAAAVSDDAETSEEVARLQQEVADLRAELQKAQQENARRRQEKAPGDDAEHRAAVKRLQREIERLKAERRAPFADAAILNAGRKAKSLFSSIKPPAGGRAKGLMDSINVAIHAELERRRKAFGRIEKSLAELTAIAPDKARDLRRKLEAIADPSASEGERANARAALARRK